MKILAPFVIRNVVSDDYSYSKPSHRKRDNLMGDKHVTRDVVRVDRISDNGKTTIGRLYYNGKFLCHTCEDTRRYYELPQYDPKWSPKVYGETCIAAGQYDLVDRRFGGFFDRYIKRFKSIIHEGMMWIKNVPNFTDVLIHCGNTHRDTHGCILVGTKRNNDFIAASATTYSRIYPIIYDSVKRGNAIIIITDVEV